MNEEGDRLAGVQPGLVPILGPQGVPDQGGRPDLDPGAEGNDDEKDGEGQRQGGQGRSARYQAAEVGVGHVVGGVEDDSDAGWHGQTPDVPGDGAVGQVLSGLAGLVGFGFHRRWAFVLFPIKSVNKKPGPEAAGFSRRGRRVGGGQTKVLMIAPLPPS